MNPFEKRDKVRREREKKQKMEEEVVKVVTGTEQRETGNSLPP